jgi:hypothetical protein
VLYPAREVAAVVGETIKHRRATHRLAREAHDLDLRDEMTPIADAGIPALVVACASDTLTTPAGCQTIAAALGCGCEQIEGARHIWVLSNLAQFRAGRSPPRTYVRTAQPSSRDIAGSQRWKPPGGMQRSALL